MATDRGNPRPLLNGKELAERLGLSMATYQRYRKLGTFRRFEVKQPIGTRRYSAALVETFLAGESVVRIGPGSRRAE